MNLHSLLFYSTAADEHMVRRIQTPAIHCTAGAQNYPSIALAAGRDTDYRYRSLREYELQPRVMEDTGIQTLKILARQL